jgi:D-glycero-D-manno-heptose 1,7-bisphosphate phosphatase
MQLPQGENRANLKAVILDRDGVINELVYFEEAGIVDSPMVPKQFRLTPDAGEAIKLLNNLGLKVVLASNQPGIAKRKMTKSNFEKIQIKMKRELEKADAHIDAEYYCLHHPSAARREYRTNCDCRKPKAGLLLRAAKDLDLNLRESFMVGDSLVDAEAGKAVGCTTYLIGSLKCDLCRLMEEKGVHPDFVLPNFHEVAKAIEERVR